MLVAGAPQGRQVEREVIEKVRWRPDHDAPAPSDTVPSCWHSVFACNRGEVGDQSRANYWKHFQLRKIAGMLHVPIGIHEPLEAHAEFTH